LSKVLPENVLRDVDPVLDRLARTRPVWSVKPEEPAPASSYEFIERMLSEEGLAVIKEAVIRRRISFEKIVGAWLDPIPPESAIPAPKRAVTKRDRGRILSDIYALKKSLKVLADLGEQPAGYTLVKQDRRINVLPAFTNPRRVYLTWVDPKAPGKKSIAEVLDEKSGVRVRERGLLDSLAFYVESLPVRRAERPSTFASLEKSAARRLVEVARESTRSTIHTERADRQDAEPQFSKPLHGLCSKLFWIRFGRTISRKTFADLVRPDGSDLAEN
jgi:hypothetical protein